MGNLFWIPDPGVKKAPDPGTRIRIRNTEKRISTVQYTSLPQTMTSSCTTIHTKKWIRILIHNQCCGTGTAGTVTFCLSGTGTGMHYGSGSEAGFGTGNNVKWNFFKSKKLKMSGQLSGEIMLLLSLKDKILP